MIRTPISASVVESMHPMEPEPRPVVAVGRVNEDINRHRRRRSVVDGARRWWRVIVSRRGSAVTLNHLGAGVRAQNRAECEDRRYYENNFLRHDRISLLLSGRLNPTSTAKLRRSRDISYRLLVCEPAPGVRSSAAMDAVFISYSLPVNFRIKAGTSERSRSK